MSSFDTVEVVERTIGIANNREFVRLAAPQDSKPNYTKWWLQYEEELRAAPADRDQLQEQLNASKERLVPAAMCFMFVVIWSSSAVAHPLFLCSCPSSLSFRIYSFPRPTS